MQVRSILLSLLVVLTSCASTSSSFTPQEVKPGKGLVVFYRQASMKGKAIRFEISSNTMGSVGVLSSGAILQLDLEPGSHTFTSRAPSLDGSDLITLDAKAGQIYYVQGKILWGWPAGRPKFTRMPDPQAQAELAKM